MEDYLIFATRLKQLRDDMGLTQKEFADKVGFTQATLSAYENNPKNPSLSIMINIATKCNVSLDWLCGLSDKKTNCEKIETYSDVIKLLLAIEKSTELDFLNSEYTGFQTSLHEYPEYCTQTRTSVIFVDNKIDEFLTDWRKMRSFFLQDTIDSDVYNLWIEKTMRKYDICISLDTLIPPDEELPFD